MYITRLSYKANNVYSISTDCGLLHMGTKLTQVSEGTLELRRNFETSCGSYMGNNTLESMQQWSPIAI